MSEARATPQTLLLKRDGAVLHVTLNRPEAFNALSRDLLTALARELQATADDQTVRVVVLAANGRAFCAGADR